MEPAGKALVAAALGAPGTPRLRTAAAAASEVRELLP